MLEKRIRVTIRNPVSIREKVYQVIRENILNGRFLPGERMVETRLAGDIHTSRTPVREALHILEREGLLESIPRVGYRVRKMRWSEVEDICEIRTVNESLAARWAMERITPDELHSLEENITLSKNAVVENPKSFVEWDSEFHEILARASGSKRLLELCQLLRRHMLRYRMKSLYLGKTAHEAIEGHSRIFQSLKKKDPVGVERAIREHLEFAKRSIQKQVSWEKETE